MANSIPATLTLKALTNELKSVLDWYSLGVNLDLKRYQLSEIESNHRGDDKRCRTEMLGCWLDNTTTPTWEAVAEALCLMEAHAVADKIRRKYIISTTTTEGANTKQLSEACPEDCDLGLSGDESDSDCRFSCGCGECDLTTYLEKGCPSSWEYTEFPYLFPKKPSTSEFRQVKWKLLKASRKIVQRFASLECNTISMLKEKLVPLDEVKNYVLTLGVIHKESVYKDKPLLLQERDKIEVVRDFGSLFFILKGYYSWFSFSIIEALREDFLFHEGTGDDERLNTYKSQFQNFCRHRIFECPKSMFSNPNSKGFISLILKVDDDFNKYNLNHVVEFQSSVSEILGLSKHTLQLCNVMDGCITVVFKMPSWLVGVITISIEQKQELMHIRVKELRVMTHIYFEDESYSLSQQQQGMKERVKTKQSTSGDPSTCDQGESTTVAMETEAHKQQEAGYKHIELNKTLSLDCKSISPMGSIQTFLDQGKSTAPLHSIARQADLKSPKRAMLQRYCSVPLIPSQPLTSPFCLKTESENIDPFDTDEQKLTQSLDRSCNHPKKPLSSTSSSVNYSPLASPRCLSPVTSPSESRKRLSQSSSLPSEKRRSLSSSLVYSSKQSIFSVRWAQSSSRLCTPKQLSKPTCSVTSTTIRRCHSLPRKPRFPSTILDSWKVGGSAPALEEAMDWSNPYSPELKLLEACQYGQLLAVCNLLMSGVNVNMATFDGETSLGQASFNGHQKVVEQLLQTGAKPDVQNKDGYSPLYYASQDGYVGIVEMLLRAGATPDLQDKTGGTPLYIASQEGHITVVQHLIAAKADVNRQTKDGTTPLYIACQQGDLPIVEQLIAAKADVNHQTKDEKTPLHITCQKGHLPVVEQLIVAKADVNHQAKDGATPLVMACENGHLPVVQHLVAVKAGINHQTKNGTTPLYIACQNGHLPVVQYLIAAKADVNHQTKDGTTPLVIACQERHIAVVQHLIAAKAAVNHQTKNGASPLYIACQNGYLPAVEKLIAAKADVNRPMKNGTTPLYIACQNGHLPVVQYLIAAKAGINHQTKDGATPLVIACAMRHLSVLEHLIAGKADVHHQTKIGATPLHIACQVGYLPVVECLIAAKAGVNHQRKDGVTPLMTASYSGHPSVVRVLLQAEATINTISQFGTALHFALAGEHEDIVQLLLEAKIDPDLPKKETALMMAARKGSVGIVRKLIQHGANVNLAKKGGHTAFDIASDLGHMDVCQELRTQHSL